ncbi:hypothetical protein ACFPES_03285 [Paenibacillus sp. GCM10023248]|uniref:hypothetical protein n=1 Tax=unclassified Paenibacillus TaxID=185978 RepID=UPI002378A738|nr:hypothetical protein [Paenibacillus sp. MAHUQ-63]MDD9266049.1 hypothetical protein [Paenibacillus sp. MAHUQ-63]
MKKELTKAQTDLKNFGGKIAGILGSIGVGLALSDAVDDAIKFEALMGTISNTLGKSMGDFVKWQNTVGDAMGFSKLSVAEMGNNYSLRLKSIAKDEQDLLKKTTDLIKAAAIIRSRTGMDQVEISDRMRSAMNQEADGADELGVNVRVAAIQQSRAYKMMANGAPWEELSEGMKKTILYYHILDSTTTNFGTEIANNTALLKGGFVAALSDVKLALGQAFLPILNIALPLLTEMARRAEVVFKNVSAFMRALFPKSNIAAGNAQAAAIDSQSGAVDGLGDSLDAAGKKAKKAANSLAGFDELNQLGSASKDDNDSKSDSVGGGLGVGMSDGFNDESTKIPTKIQELADKFRKAINDFIPEEDKKRLSDSLGNLKNSFGELGESIEDLVKSISNSKPIQDFWDQFKSESAKRVSYSIDSIAGGIRSWAGTIQLISGLISGDFEKAFNGFEKNISGSFDAITGFIGIFSPETANKMKEWKKEFSDTWSGLKEEIKKYGDPTKLEALDFAEYIRDKVSTKFGEMKESIGKTWYAIENGIVWDAVKTKVVAYWEEMKGETETKWTEFKEVLSKGWENTKAYVKWDEIKKAIVDKWTDLKTETGTKWDEFKQSLSTKWEETKAFVKWDEIKNTIVTSWENLKTDTGTKWDELKKKVSEKFDLIAKLDFSGVNTAVLAVWGELTEKTGEIWEGIGTAIKNGINSAIDLVNGFIDKVNAIKINIPSVSVPGTDIVLGGGSIGMPQIPKIPRLARGGIVDSPTIAQIGEAGSEMVVPLENTSFVDKLAGALGNAVLTAMQFSNGGNSNNKSGDVNLIIDGVSLARVVGPYLNKENSRIGGSMITTT